LPARRRISALPVYRRDHFEKILPSAPIRISPQSCIPPTLGRGLCITPPDFAVYIVGLVLEWIDPKAGSPHRKMQRRQARSVWTPWKPSAVFIRCPVGKKLSKTNVSPNQSRAEGLGGLGGRLPVGPAVHGARACKTPSHELYGRFHRPTRELGIARRTKEIVRGRGRHLR